MVEPSGVKPRGTVRIVGCHAEGEIGDVIVGGVDAPPGATIWDQARFIAADESLRNFVLNEPRGGVFRHVNLLVPPVHPEAVAGFIIMEPCHTPPMSGSNSICVATVLLETGRVPMEEPLTRFAIEAPGGLVRVEAICSNGKAERITITNVASFVARLDAPLVVDGIGEIRVDTAYGGDSFVMVDASDLGMEIEPGSARELAELGRRVTIAANEQLGFVHPDNPDWHHISFCQIAGPLERIGDGVLSMRSTSVIDPGKLDRSPTGTGVSARMALLHSRGDMAVGHRLVMRSVINSEFVGTIRAETSVGNQAAIIPTISGRAWITGIQEHTLDPTDPWPLGYRLSDTWPGG